MPPAYGAERPGYPDAVLPVNQGQISWRQSAAYKRRGYAPEFAGIVVEHFRPVCYGVPEIRVVLSVEFLGNA